jgi:hypothetical protein
VDDIVLLLSVMQVFVDRINKLSFQSEIIETMAISSLRDLFIEFCFEVFSLEAPRHAWLASPHCGVVERASTHLPIHS